MSERRFDGRVAVITGSGRGLGFEYAKLLSSLGAKVVINDNGSSLDGSGADTSVAQAAVDQIKAAGGEAVACTASVATPEGGKAIIDTALSTWGRIDILIHNAGNTRFDALAEITHEAFRSLIDVHLLGAFNVVQPAFPAMCQAGYGRVVLTLKKGEAVRRQHVLRLHVEAVDVVQAAVVGLGHDRQPPRLQGILA